LNPPITVAGDPPQAVGTNYTLLSGGKTHTCGSKGRGVTCWGVNDEAQLDGIGVEPAIASVPGASIGDAEVTHMTTGQGFTCIATAADDVWCWGAELNWTDTTFEGVKGTVTRVQPGFLTPGTVTALDAGEGHVCAIKGGRLWCWGSNDTGQSSGEPSALPIEPTQPLGDTEVVAVAAGKQHTCAVTSDHRILCWGDNAQGQLGSVTASTAPVEVVLEARPIGEKLLAAGDNHTCALLEDSWIHCWGAPEFTTEATPAVDLTRFILCF
jgi:alpha-tubulin suppressor-like RCC1 family protein